MGKVRQILFGNHDPYAGLDLLPFNGHGWASQSEAFDQIINLIKPKLIVEVGTWMGGSARYMAGLAKVHNPDVEVVCVDTFLGSVEHWTKESYLMPLENGRPNIYRQFLSNNMHHGLQDTITPFPVDSINAFEVFKHYKIQPDMIYIDAAHDYDSVYKDLDRWSQLLPVGGFLVGDDFHHPPIIQAVNDVFGAGGFTNVREKYIWEKL